MNQFPEDKLKTITAFLEQPLIARMAMVDHDGHPHVIPVWYGWDGQFVWISSFVNTRKYGYLLENPHLSLVIDIVDPSDMNKNHAVIFEGKVELIIEPKEFIRTHSEWIYTRYLGIEGVKAPEPHSWTVDADNRLIKLIPENRVIWGF